MAHQPGGMPPLWPNYGMPFYYQSLSVVEYLYAVEPRDFAAYFGDAPLDAAHFSHDGREACAVSWNFELYTATFNAGFNPDNPTMQAAAATTEMEVCIVAYPRSEHANVPKLSFDEFIKGADQTKLLGSWHVHVPADNPIAVEAGKDNFGEPKFLTTFSIFNVPAPNGTDAASWDVQLNDPSGYDPRNFIFRFQSDLVGLVPLHANPSPITYYGMAPLSTDPSRRVFIGNRWNLLQPMQLFAGDGDPKRCRITYGSSRAQNMAADMQRLIGGASPTAIRVYQSPVAAIEGRAFYAY